MTDGTIYRGWISGNQLKIVACIAMLIDHIGMILLPDMVFLRIIGRIAMPLFAFTFAEGCFYSKHKLRRFLLILGLGLVTSAVMSFAEGELQGNILITLSLSSLIIYALDALKKSIFRRERGKIVCFSFALLTALALAVGVCCFSGVEIDYGIMGILLPVTVRLPDFGSFGAKAALASIYTPVTVFLLFSAWLIALSLVLGGVQFFCLVAIIPIACYSGQRGKHNLKGLFYVFYPAHLALLAAIYLILNSDFLSTLF